MPENPNSQTPAAGGDPQTGVQDAAAGQGAGTGVGTDNPSTGTLDVNSLRAQIEAELRPAIEADVKRKLAAEISKAQERAQKGEQVDELAAERRAHAAKASAHERLSVAYTLLGAANDSLLAVLYRRPDPDTRWRLPVLGLRVPHAVERGVRCAVPAGVAGVLAGEAWVGAIVGAACVVVVR